MDTPNKGLEMMKQMLRTTCWLGLCGHDVAFADSSSSYHMTTSER